MLDRLQRIHPKCLTCTHFEASLRRCQRYGVEVPAPVQATGCEHWEYDEIPF
jgi:hypothetical protein